MANQNTTYSSIIKSIFLFGGVRVISIILNVVKNKVISILMGASGIGIFGIYLSASALLNSVFGLGISQSLVRNLSEVYYEDSKESLNKILTVINKLLVITSVLGLLGTLILSPLLSKWTFYGSENILPYALLSISTFFNIFNLGQLAILQGLRKLNELALATIYGAFIGLILSLPLYVYFYEQGIVFSFIVTSFTAYLFSNYYVRRSIIIPKTKLSIKDVILKGSDTIKLGVAMMSVSLVVSLFGLVLRSFINKYSGLVEVGIFQAGFTIITSYFGLIFTAMATDYFPRLSAINKNNVMIGIEVNKQVEILQILLGPLIVVLIGFMNYLILVLYNEEFLEASVYVNWAILGIIFQAGSQTMGMVLLAKNRSNVFIYSVFIFQSIFLLNNIAGYVWFGFFGLGVTFAINMFIHLVGIQLIMYRLYKIQYNSVFFKLLMINISIFTFSILISKINYESLKYFLLATLFIISIFFSLNHFKKISNISSIKSMVLNKIKSKLKK